MCLCALVVCRSVAVWFPVCGYFALYGPLGIFPMCVRYCGGLWRGGECLRLDQLRLFDVIHELTNCAWGVACVVH